MNNFPVTIVDNTTPLDESMLKESDQDLIGLLSGKGYEVHSGLDFKYAEDISKMCLQQSIREYCPNDSLRRFINIDSTKAWIAKGRAVYLLIKKEDASLAGYGWSGTEVSDHVLGGQVTFALRVGEGAQGQGLATPFSRLIISATARMFEAQNFWLETWSSDGAAVHIYHKLGFSDVDQLEDNRPTADGQTVPDTRLYMSLPNDVL
jgi:ribosomal protein S18 acetylase RimI-like enzyme